MSYLFYQRLQFHYESGNKVTKENTETIKRPSATNLSVTSNIQGILAVEMKQTTQHYGSLPLFPTFKSSVRKRETATIAKLRWWQ